MTITKKNFLPIVLVGFLAVVAGIYVAQLLLERREAKMIAAAGEVNA